MFLSSGQYKFYSLPLTLSDSVKGFHLQIFMSCFINEYCTSCLILLLLLMALQPQIISVDLGAV